MSMSPKPPRSSAPLRMFGRRLHAYLCTLALLALSACTGDIVGLTPDPADALTTDTSGILDGTTTDTTNDLADTTQPGDTPDTFDSSDLADTVDSTDTPISPDSIDATTCPDASQADITAPCTPATCDDKNACTLDRCGPSGCQSHTIAVPTLHALPPAPTLSGAWGQLTAISPAILVTAAPSATHAIVFVHSPIPKPVPNTPLPAWTLDTSLAPAATSPTTATIRALAIWGPPTADGTTIAISRSDQSVCLHVRSAGAWLPDGCITPPTPPAPADNFGASIALSGSTLLIGAPGTTNGTGKASVYLRTATGWTHQTDLTPWYTYPTAHFGNSVAIDGDNLVIGAVGDPGEATGVSAIAANPQPPSSKPESGAAWLFTRVNSAWQPSVYLKAANPDPSDHFGRSVAISGGRVVIGADGEASSVSTINGDPTDNSTPGRGAAYVFHAGTGAGVWTQHAYLKPTTTGADAFGTSVAIHGQSILVGAPQDSSGGAGVGSRSGNGTPFAQPQSGAAWLFALTDGQWTATSHVKSTSPANTGHFGTSVSLSAHTAAIGAPDESACNFPTGSGTLHAFAVNSPCDDADPCTADSCQPATGCVHTALSACQPTCGDGVCAGEETVPNCPADCGFLTNRYAGPCATPGSWDGCPEGYVCVARSAKGGGNVCTADFEGWAPIGDSHPASDFEEYGEYDVDKKTGLFWAKAIMGPMKWEVALSACTTQTYGGFEDWRIPTQAELLTLVDYSVHSPASSLPGASWPDYPIKLYRDLLSGVHVDAGQLAWGADLWNLGDPVHVPNSYLGYARCVRVPDAKPKIGLGSRLEQVKTSPTVLDRVSGLEWTGVPAAPSSWGAASTACGSSELSGATEWRLPTIGELRQMASRSQELNFTDASDWGGWTSSPQWKATYLGGPADQASSWSWENDKAKRTANCSPNPVATKWSNSGSLTAGLVPFVCVH